MSIKYLFDWGDTLMVDFPQYSGKMCHWPQVEAIAGAKETLQYLADKGKIYIATGAADSTESEIKLAFERVGLAKYISGYFCQSNLGVGKGCPAFFHEILQKLSCSAEQVVMIGDTINKDIQPALATGLRAIWFNPKKQTHVQNNNIEHVHHLSELCQVL